MTEPARGVTAREMSEAIGVFDSGVGGLTVLRALWRALPDEPTVYLGDTARVPYGTRSADVVTRYALNNARTLLEKRPLKMLVVACNTASAVAIAALREALPIPVVGVIEPGARAARAVTRGGTVMVLGTQGTVRSGAYVRALEAHQGDVTQRACPLLVPLVEEGWTEGEIPEAVLARYLVDLPSDLDTVILGCTHYPLLRASVERVLKRLGVDAAVVDGAEATASEVQAILEANGLRVHDEDPLHDFLLTDAPAQLSELAPRFLGREVPEDQVQLVDVIVK
jgi:glutamate racemase